MDPRERDELRMLQERLYGRGADPLPDEEAAERLRQLTVRTESPRVAASDIVGRVDLDEDDLEDENDDEDDLKDDDLDAPGGGPASASRRWRPSRPMAILWTCSVVVAVALMIVATSALLPERLVPDRSAEGANPIAVLEVDPAFEAPGFFYSGGGEREATGFEEFSGVRAIVATGGFGFSTGTDDQMCLSIVISADLGTATDYSYDGTIFESCSANAFPASVQFMVTEEMPAEIRDVFPAGTALRFDYDERNDDVVVSVSSD